jgi:hypothetical protein
MRNVSDTLDTGSRSGASAGLLSRRALDTIAKLQNSSEKRTFRRCLVAGPGSQPTDPTQNEVAEDRLRLERARRGREQVTEIVLKSLRQQSQQTRERGKI